MTQLVGEISKRSVDLFLLAACFPPIFVITNRLVLKVLLVFLAAANLRIRQRVNLSGRIGFSSERQEQMNHTCTVCGSTWSQVVADAAALGIQPKTLRSVYTCCQIAEWALEQQLVWAEAAQEDRVAEEESVGVLVPVRLRQPQTARLKNRDQLS